MHPSSLPVISQIDQTRVQWLNARPLRQGARHVLYWMQQSQRAEQNHALEYAVRQANSLSLPLVVAFGLMDDYPGANVRHYLFMVQGLRETAAALHRRGADFVLQHGAPASIALLHEPTAALVVCDRGYTRHQRAWREEVATKARCPVVQVESDVVVPVEFASNKAEFAARTIRPKLYRSADRFLSLLRPTKLVHAAESLAARRLDLEDPEALCRQLRLDRSVLPVSRYFIGGTREAKRRFRNFCQTQFSHYAKHRSEPVTGDVSHMSAYLHFGQISPVWLIHELRAAGARQPALKSNIDSYFEELLIRRELGMNFVFYQPDYDRFAGLPTWARTTLAEHRADRRPHRYAREDLEAGRTHDPYWNAAMKEMRVTGYMHNHLRMYWGKKLLEWGASPEKAYETALAINNKYFLCGRDPASFANIGWVFGLHDRPWGERPIYGKVRCMMASGLERKCEIGAYVEKVNSLPEG